MQQVMTISPATPSRTSRGRPKHSSFPRVVLRMLAGVEIKRQILPFTDRDPIRRQVKGHEQIERSFVITHRVLPEKRRILVHQAKCLSVWRKQFLGRTVAEGHGL